MADTKNTKQNNQGIIIRIAGPVVDVYFEQDVPSLFEALTIPLPDGKELVLEVQFEIGDHEVRALAFGSTDGLARGTKVERTHSPITVPVGEKTLGRIFNVLGEPIDEQKFDNEGVTYESIHKDPPLLTDQETKPHILETGLKV